MQCITSLNLKPFLILQKVNNNKKIFNFIVYIIQVKALTFLLKQTKQAITNGWKFNSNNSILDLFLWQNVFAIFFLLTVVY